MANIAGTGDSLIQDANFVAEQYATQQVTSLGPAPLPGSVAITSLNGISGPTINFSGGTTGLSFVPGGTTITLSGTLVIANGGTGGATSLAARTNLEVARLHVALVAPAVTDDRAAGYPTGTSWIDTVLQDAYVSVDDSAGTAVWKKTTP